jgi:predicted nucleic acid-binding protein
MGWRRSDKEMERLSLDSSVAIKWFSKEEDSEKALKLLNAYINGNIIFVTSHLLFYEVANALRYKPDLTENVKRAVEALFKLHMKVIDLNDKIMIKSIEIAYEDDVTVYDAIPVAVAEVEEAVCITADEKTQYSKLKEKHSVILLKEYKI